MMPIFTILALLLATGAAPDPFDGTWQMNLKKSKYKAGTLPKAMKIKMETVAEGVHYVSETTQPDGKVLLTEYTAAYDERPMLVRSGAGLTTPVALKRIDANTVEATYRRMKDVQATSRRTVSKDGKTMTITTVSKDKAGKSVTNIGVFTRVEEAK